MKGKKYNECNGNISDNEEKSTILYEYLINDDKKYLKSIQELIMGSGKSSSITPYICLLLLKHCITN